MALAKNWAVSAVEKHFWSWCDMYGKNKPAEVPLAQKLEIGRTTLDL